jgi:threonine synthase
MVAVDAQGRAPLAVGFDAQKERVIRASKGCTLAVSDEQILACQKELACREGIFAAPQGAACLAGLKQLSADGWLGRDERVVFVNTGSGLNYL